MKKNIFSASRPRDGNGEVFRHGDPQIAKENPGALKAFYASFLGFIPVVGIVFGFAAFAMAMISLMQGRSLPDQPGKQHAYMAMLVSVLVLLGQLFGIAYVVSIFDQRNLLPG